MNIDYRTFVWNQYGAAFDMLDDAIWLCPNHLYDHGNRTKRRRTNRHPLKPMPPVHETHRSEVLFIGGRAGTGKRSMASALHVLLAARGIAHALIEGDNLDLAYPPQWEHRLAEKNLQAIWANYGALGYRRLIYTNVMCVVGTDILAAAMGDDPIVMAVLLDVADDAMCERLSRRESPRSLAEYLARNMELRA